MLPTVTPNLEHLRISQPWPYLAYFSAFIDRSFVAITVRRLSWQDAVNVTHKSRMLCGPADVKQENYEPTGMADFSTFGSTVGVTLGHQVFTRPGAFFPQCESQEEWDWLRAYSSIKKLLELLEKTPKTLAIPNMLSFAAEYHSPRTRFLQVILLTDSRSRKAYLQQLSVCRRPVRTSKHHWCLPTSSCCRVRAQYEHRNLAQGF